MKTILFTHYEPSHNVFSPIVQDYELVVKKDVDGSDITVYQAVDYSDLIRSNGSVDNWSINALTKAGIDPSFLVRTGFTTRLQGINALEVMEADIASYFDSIKSDDSKAE